MFPNVMILYSRVQRYLRFYNFSVGLIPDLHENAMQKYNLTFWMQNNFVILFFFLQSLTDNTVVPSTQ